ncbi:hypothetical protein POTOM_010058 [Populus tomentosa]|uniref:Hydroxyproline-rich glycoprotein family protein n=1 Tax=Populus tomentosa TaxID=118781 RepID=A0A8X8AD49_POPTO|nr:hypothetical protein POTOM_010058 [Populus tomentosa]
MEEGDSNRPSLGFPVGLVLLLFMLFIMSGLFSCCLHWEKVLSLLGVSSEDNHSHIEEDVEHLPQKSSPPHVELKKNQGQSLPVLMPGDQVPKFIAMACPLMLLGDGKALSFLRKSKVESKQELE